MPERLSPASESRVEGHGDQSPSILPEEGPSTVRQENVTSSKLKRFYHRVTYTPQRVRYDSNKEIKFTTFLNILFAFAGTFTVANLYYPQPILNRLAHDFNVSYEDSARIPTLAQAGYACGMAFICPLGDIMRRRPFTLYLVWLTATLWYVCYTFAAKSKLQLSSKTNGRHFKFIFKNDCARKVADYWQDRPLYHQIISSILRTLIPDRPYDRIVAQFIGWRYIYWISFALQYLILAGLYLYMPDYPATNKPKSIVRYYPRLLLDIVRLFVTEPLIVQICLIGFCTSVIFMSFWTTLTFLLADDPYNYSSLVIGLFALIGIGSMAWGPIFARTVIDKFIPMLSTISGELIVLMAVCVGTYTGLHTVAGPILEALFLDIGIQTAQIANRSALYGVAPLARNRVNTCYMVFTFAGQLTGTAAGNHLYAEGGWIRSGSANVGFVGLALVLCVVRGPHETHWLGWRGGWKLRKGVPTKDQAMSAEEQTAAISKTMPERTDVAPGSRHHDLDSEKGSDILESDQISQPRRSTDSNPPPMESSTEKDIETGQS
ncbi:MAG: hypothetical protein Q9227_003557 [Pyrenula ochraceoflavens]